MTSTNSTEPERKGRCEFIATTKRYGASVAVDRIDLRIPEATYCCLLGPSGCGKTTTLRMLAGHEAVSEGDILLDNVNVTDLPPARRGTAMMFQSYALFPHLTVEENVAFSMKMKGVPKEKRLAEAAAMLKLVELDRFAQRLPSQLSGGQQQRVALARALITHPSVLLLDEPLSALDTRTRAAAARRLAEVLAETEVPTILVTHDFTEAAMLGDEVAVDDGGEVVQRGTASALAARPATAFVADFTGSVVLHGTATPEADGTTTVTLLDGTRLRSTDAARGPVVATVFPWEITVHATDGARGADRSTQNELRARIVSITTIGGRVRLALTGPEPLIAEVSTTAIEHLGLRAGDTVTASWKATATRLVPDG